MQDYYQLARIFYRPTVSPDRRTVLHGVNQPKLLKTLSRLEHGHRPPQQHHYTFEHLSILKGRI